MAKSPTIHWNPMARNDGKTRCGILLRYVEHRTDPADATCNNCRRLIKLDQAAAAAAPRE